MVSPLVRGGPAARARAAGEAEAPPAARRLPPACSLCHAASAAGTRADRATLESASSPGCGARIGVGSGLTLVIAGDGSGASRCQALSCCSLSRPGGKAGLRVERLADQLSLEANQGNLGSRPVAVAKVTTENHPNPETWERTSDTSRGACSGTEGARGGAARDDSSQVGAAH